MNYPFSYRLKRPVYVYADGRTHADKLRGLLDYAPYRAATIKTPRCIFIFDEGDSRHAQQLYLALKNGIGKYPGTKRLTGISLEKDNVHSIRVPICDEKKQSQAFFEAVTSYIESNPRPDFAFVLQTKQPQNPANDPYYGAKAALTREGIPSQFVSWELLDSEYLFKFAISNIALAMFVKLGGMPWSISLGRRLPSLVLGVGHARVVGVSGEMQRHIGFAVCMLSNGIYLQTRFFAPANNYKSFLENIDAGLKQALEQLASEQTEVERITIHVSRFERHELTRQVQNTVREFHKTAQASPPFEVIRLNADSDFSVFDLSHVGYVSEEGIVVGLGNRHALLVTEGRRETAVWRGRKPVTLELHREYASSPVITLKHSLEDIFHLSAVNWRGFNTKNQPISLQYAQLLAERIAKMSHFVPDVSSDIEKHSQFSSSPWFI